MVKFLFWSDLHREFGSYEHPVEIPYPPKGVSHEAGQQNLRNEIDAILVAGDLHVHEYHVPSLEEIQDAWGVPVISVRGNHEFYQGNFTTLPARMTEQTEEVRARGKPVHVLDQDVIVIGDTRTLGVTLWTDFAICGNQADMMFGARRMMNDYRKIMASTPGALRDELLLPKQTLEKHLSDRAWLIEELNKPWPGKTLVMTHHIPVPEALDPDAGKGDYAPCYVSDLREDVLGLKIDAWISGHSHQAVRGTLPGLHGDIAFLSNMKGYPGQKTNFEPYRVLDMDAPTKDLSPIEISDPVLSHLEDAQSVIDRLRETVTAAVSGDP
ncbi:metallophosphoesterase [Paracoccus litorisediminis]|uniref:metallophosphoesterase n=1 Tax=Paracoccus litorisediminis TaxID=2006130 RepID=UPI0037337F9A